MIPSESSHLHIAARSHPGMSGKNNEDRYNVSAFRRSADQPEPVVFAIVSDGIGGHQAGEVAAEIAVRTIRQAVADSDGSQPVQTLRQSIIQASQAIALEADRQPEKQGMGATCACAWVISERLFTANVGDSRIYLLRAGHIVQISTDHTWVQEALDAGILTPEQSRSHPNAHVIRRYLGGRQPIQPDLRLRLQPGESDAQAEMNQGAQLLPGDLVLLCSDGLTDLVNADELLSAFTEGSLEHAAKALVEKANQRGGHDNITLVAMQVPNSGRKMRFSTKKKGDAGRRWLALVIALAFLLAGLLIGAGVIYFLLR